MLSQLRQLEPLQWCQDQSQSLLVDSAKKRKKIEVVKHNKITKTIVTLNVLFYHFYTIHTDKDSDCPPSFWRTTVE